MSEKALRMVLIVVAGLVLVYAASAMFARRPSDGGALMGDALEVALESVRGSELVAVRMSGPDGEAVELNQSANRWTVDGYAADSAAVNRLETALAEARIVQLAAVNPANHARLGVDSSEAFTLELEDAGGAVTTLLVGETGSSAGTVYVRLPGQDETFAVSTDLRTPVSRSAYDWRDRTIVRVDTTAVARIEITRDGATYALERDDASWRIDDSGAAAAAALNGILAELADLQAQGFAPEGAELGEPERTLTAHDAQGTTLAEIRVYGDETTTFRATATGAAATFEIAGWKADRLIPPRDELMPAADRGDGASRGPASRL